MPSLVSIGGLGCVEREGGRVDPAGEVAAGVDGAQVTQGAGLGGGREGGDGVLLLLWGRQWGWQ